MCTVRKTGMLDTRRPALYIDSIRMLRSAVRSIPDKGKFQNELSFHSRAVSVLLPHSAGVCLGESSFSFESRPEPTPPPMAGWVLILRSNPQPNDGTSPGGIAKNVTPNQRYRARFHRRDDPGSHPLSRVDRRWMGSSLLSSQGLHTGLHHGTRCGCPSREAVCRARRKSHRPERRSSVKPQ